MGNSERLFINQSPVRGVNRGNCIQLQQIKYLANSSMFNASTN